MTYLSPMLVGLQAAVQHHVQPATLAGVAVAAGRHVEEAAGGHAVAGRVGQEGGLVELDELAGRRGAAARIERRRLAVDPLQQGAGGVEGAVVDVGRTELVAGVAEVVGGHRMLGRQVLLV
ncbi:hypothetical protein [Rugamonas sp. DEMB1]|uniref:hypothetical protein n=1 Tax=Rugamonas sp. DEMB1 TaxID=3039386 RepID=UPI0024473F8F|nr:hypothetical protein [Rugamonas sp. DEMB1]WGG50416.1 hypothetical protein QC826_29085 [Rugamonas sp. DEMB1]